MTGGNINGVNAITWDGSDDALIIPPNPSLIGTFSTGGTIIFVARLDNGGGFPRLCQWNNEASVTFTNGGAVMTFNHLFTGTDLQSRSPYGTGTAKIMTVTYNGENVGNPVTSYRDGALLTQNLSSIPTGAIEVGSGELAIGNELNLNRAFDGDIGEIIVYDHILTDSERDDIHDYLSNRWSITLV